MPPQKVGCYGHDLNGDHGQQEADRRLCCQCGADEAFVGDLAENGGEDAGVGDDGGAPYEKEHDQRGRRCGEEHRRGDAARSADEERGHRGGATSETVGCPPANEASCGAGDSDRGERDDAG